MYNSNKITQAWTYLMITLAKQRACVAKSEVIYDSLSETLQEPLFGSFFFIFFLQFKGG